MKRKIFLLAVAAIFAAILASGTLAYFTAEDQVHNVITSDAIKIEIEEWQDEVGNPYPDEPIFVMPGTTVSKIPTVKNLEAQAWIRARYEVVFIGADEVEMAVPSEVLAELVTVGVDEANWLRKEGDELWWYCAAPTDSGASTEPFFTQVTFDGPNMTNEYQGCTCKITVFAQAVQHANNGETVLEAAGWPADE